MNLEEFVKLPVDPALMSLATIAQDKRQPYYDAYQAANSVDLKNPPITFENAPSSTDMATYAGWALMIFGIGLIGWAFLADVSGGEIDGTRVANLDRMSQRLMLLMTGIGSFTSAVLTFGFAAIINALKAR